jgi:hypothetical protein
MVLRRDGAVEAGPVVVRDSQCGRRERDRSGIRKVRAIMNVDGPERLGRNEATFRRINEAIEAGRVTRDGVVGFVCECSRLGCNEVVQLTIAEYEHVRSDPRRFFIVPGHDGPVEDVVDAGDRFWIVDKRGEAGQVAEETD